MIEKNIFLSETFLRCKPGYLFKFLETFKYLIVL